MTDAIAAPPSESAWKHELTDLVRGMSGGLLFGVPLLYTMEVWWTGARTSPQQTATVLAVLSVPAFVLNKTAGFRTSKDVRLVDAAADTIETLALGMMITALVLVLLRQITTGTPVAAGVGMIVYESIPFCLGVGVARHFLAGSRDGAGGSGDADAGSADTSASTATADDGLNGTLADLGATVIGAVFISLSIAPTDEVPMVAASIGPAWLLVFVAASLLISYGIVFAAGFSGQDRRQSQEGVLQLPITETVACYLVALAVATLMLWLFQRGLQPWTDAVTRVVILGLPATVGGAAGRLAI